MSEIKTACRGTSRLIEVATMTHEEYLNLHAQGAKELRAAYEALKAENEALRKELAEIEAERNRRDEMRKALEAQMGISNKWQS